MFLSPLTLCLNFFFPVQCFSHESAAKMGIKNQNYGKISEIVQTLSINDTESCMIDCLLQGSCLIINKMTHYKSILIINNYVH